MQLMQASQELFRRTPDECFSSLESLVEYCQRQKDDSEEVWQPPKSLGVLPSGGSQLLLSANGEDGFSMNDWSFGQLCRLSRVSKETVNRLSPQTAANVFRETLPRAEKPLQLYAEGDRLRSIHAASYTRLFNADLLDVIQEFATDFQPPQKGLEDRTGLYAGHWRPPYSELFKKDLSTLGVTPRATRSASP